MNRFLEKVKTYLKFIKIREEKGMNWEQIGGILIKHLNLLDEMKAVDTKVQQLIGYANTQGGTVTLEQVKQEFGL